MSKFVCCDVCRDTHLMLLDGHKVPCTACPTPCEKCRKGGYGAFCAETPCSCECHEKAELDRTARRSDTDHGPEKPTAHWVDGKDLVEGHYLVYGETAQEAREKARDKLLIALARAVPVTSRRSLDELLKAARALEELL